MLLHPPAKLNRFLHIVGRRDDGYHRLQTAFELIDWCDELRIEPRSDGVIERRGGPPEVDAEADLVVRAARLLQPLAAPGCGCTLTLTKHIPSGAGLGGGSSDAAAVLLGLNRIWKLGLEVPDLIRIGVQLGADVPVFLGQQPAYAEGIGERLQALPHVERFHAVIFPGISLATGRMFAHPNLCRDCRPISRQQYLAGALTTNVFEPVAQELAPAVGQALDWLRQRLGAARLTGSGSAVYAEASTLAAAEAALAGVPASWTCRAARSITNWFDNNQRAA